MITKEQAMTADNFIQTAYITGENKVCYPSGMYMFVPSNETKPLDKPMNWRRNGKTKVWKTRPLDFKIPVKHGLYSYGYIDQTNAHLFEVAE